jgi:hypothetical protein
MDSDLWIRTLSTRQVPLFLSYIQQNDASQQPSPKKIENKGPASGFLGGSWRKGVGYQQTITKTVHITDSTFTIRYLPFC